MSGKNLILSLNGLLIVAFLALLFTPLLSFLDGAESQIAEVENRPAAGFPAWRLKKNVIRAFPDQFNRWFSDHMGLRQSLVKIHSLLNRDWLNSHDSVLAGSEDWLFLLREPRIKVAKPPIPADYCGRHPFSAGELERWKQHLIANWRELQQSGREYVLMIVPNKQTIYANYFPKRISCQAGTSRLDQLLTALAEYPDFPLLDLRRVFKIQSEPRLWYRTDTHWNGLGANLAFDTLLNHLNRKSGLELENAISTSRFSMSVRKTKGWGLAVMSGLKHSFIEREPQIVPRKPRATPLPNPFPKRTGDPRRQPEAFIQTGTSLPSILVLHDSFFDKRIKRLLTDSFSQSTFVWHKGSPALGQEEKLIDTINPDIVLHEMVERNLLHDYLK